MIDESTAVLPLWMVLSAAFGFIVGEICGDQARLRKCLEQVNADLRDQLQKAQACAPTLQRTLDQQRKVINDIHRRNCRVPKGLEKPAS